MENVETLSLDEIIRIEDRNVRKEAFKMYMEYIKWLKENNFQYFLRKYGYISMQELTDIYYKNISDIIFQGDLIVMYANFKKQKSQKQIFCDLTHRTIEECEKYIIFRPLLQNLNNKKVYTLKRSIKVHEEEEDFLPKDILDFELLSGALEYKNISYKDYDLSYLEEKYPHGLILMNLS